MELYNIFWTILLSIMYLYVCFNIMNVIINWKDIKIYLGIIILFVILLFFDYISFFKFPIMFLSLTLITAWISSYKVSQSFIVVFLLNMFSIVVEIPIVIIFSKINNNLTLPLNCIIILIVNYLTKFSTVKKIRNYLMNNQPKNFIIIIMFIFFLFNITNISYIKDLTNSLILFLSFNLVYLLFTILVIRLLLEKNEYQKIDEENKTLMKTLKNYEYLIEQQRIANHENKNQLLTIKTLINDKKISNQIDSIIEKSDSNINQQFLSDIQYIPFALIKGFLYYKYLEAKRLDIDLKLEVGKNVRIVSEDSLSNDDLTDLLKIMGVFLDNALQTVEKLDTKEVKINVFRNKDNKLLVSIANTFEGKIDLTHKIAGTSTKGEGHGYGLLLVEDILKKNSRFKNITEIIDNIFIQNLTIDLNKKGTKNGSLSSSVGDV